MELLPDGSYKIFNRVDIPGHGISDFMFGRGWLLEILDLSGGEYFFYSDGKEVKPSRSHFGVFYPPYTLVRCGVNEMKGRVRGFGSQQFYRELPSAPIMFETDFDDQFSGVEQALDVLNSSRKRQSIEVNTKPSLLALKTKRLIDENFLVYPSISKIAGRLEVSPEHLSRQFKRDYGLTPSAYLHQLRVSEATFKLAFGEEIIEISQDVGYNDLSRFYKQFRKATRTSPAVCRAMLKK